MENSLKLSTQILRNFFQELARPYFLLCDIVAFYLIGLTNIVVPGMLSWHDEQRMGEVFFLVLLFVIWGYSRIQEKYKSAFISLISIRVIRCLALFAALGAVSAMTSQFPRWAFLEWAWLLSLVGGTILIANLRFDADQKFDRAILLAIAVTCLVYLINVLAIYVALFFHKSINTRLLYYGFSNPRFFGQFQTMSLPLLALLIFYSRSPLQRIASFVFLGMWWMLSFSSGTRGTWLGMFVALVAVMIIGKKVGRVWARLQLWGIAIGMILYGLLFFVPPGWAGAKGGLIARLPDITGLSRRDVLWGKAWDMIVAHPIFGVGPMNFATQPNGVGAHPHNAILQIGAEWGVPALLLIGGLIFLGLLRLAQRLHSAERQESSQSMLPTALFAALVAAATQSLVDGIIVMPYTQVVLMLLAGWSMGWYYSTMDRPREIASHRGRTIVATLTGLVLLGVIAYTIFPDVLHLDARERAFQVQHGNYFLPRFWRQGWIDQ